MKRNKFILSMLTAAAAPRATYAAKQKSFSGTDRGFKVAAGEGRIHGHIKLKGVTANVKIA